MSTRARASPLPVGKLLTVSGTPPLNEIAYAAGTKPCNFSWVVRLNYLAPNIVASILDAAQPDGLTRGTLLKQNLALDWAYNGDNLASRRCQRDRLKRCRDPHGASTAPLLDPAEAKEDRTAGRWSGRYTGLKEFKARTRFPTASRKLYRQLIHD